MPNISFHNVKKVYPNGTYALDGVSFDINEGDFVCIVGESGGGKTTLLKLIAGLETSTAGEIYFDGEISNYLKVAKRNVAYVFQEYTIYPNMTVFENIVFSLKKENMSYDEKCQLADEIIKKMELEVIQGELPRHLSFGQCQKVALARALVRKPNIILFDEPLSNIDESSKNEYKKLILYAKKILPSSTFVYVTHKIDDAMKLSNKIMVLDNGKILQYDQKQNVFEFPNCTAVADYMIDYKEEFEGFIKNNKFISKEKEFVLTDYQIATLSKINNSKVKCYHTKNINYYFYLKGNAITGIKKEYVVNKVTLKNNKLKLLNHEIDLSILENAFISKECEKVVFIKEKFSLEEKENYFKLSGTIAFSNIDYIVVKIEDLLIPFNNNKKFKEGESLDVYYPIYELILLDKENQKINSSYAISKNIIECRITNQKKGIIKVGKIKVFNESFKRFSNNVKLEIPLDALIINEKGKFICNTLFNEEFLGNKTLIHFESVDLCEYLSAIVDGDFKGYKMKNIKFDIDFEKIKLLNGE